MTGCKRTQYSPRVEGVSSLNPVFVLSFDELGYQTWLVLFAVWPELHLQEVRLILSLPLGYVLSSSPSFKLWPVSSVCGGDSDVFQFGLSFVLSTTPLFSRVMAPVWFFCSARSSLGCPSWPSDSRLSFLESLLLRVLVLQ